MIPNQKRIAECYQPLFDYLHNEHGLILLGSEMDEIIRLVEIVNLKNKINYEHETTLNHETPPIANVLLADSASFWMNADKSTVQNYLKENVEDMDEYTRKKQEIMKRCKPVL